VGANTLGGSSRYHQTRSEGPHDPSATSVRHAIFRMVAENTTWGAPRIHRELLMLGFDISERTISRWIKQAPRDSEPAKRVLFSRTIERRSRQWTSSRCQRLRSACSTASSSSVMIGGASCTLTSRNIRPAVGSSTSCARHFPLKPLTNT